ncbi:MAG TPA: hypothetical protein VFI91_13710 [Longimicrobiaceae bacterium]|nr:hypothetical protein [Longimicrobiaceae bacterium]
MNEQHWLVRPGTVRILWIVFAVVLILTVIPDFFIEKHASFPIENIFGFYAWFGFLTCVGMVLFAKGMSLLVKRKDTYYDD